ncbi:hypothetical protein C9374_004258 [Naegleria lovaniensis]|uniref:Uncharacterized protein n=1 Tax=Naegleria lovaniensis TaxID=51637 RepID=A0AA88GSK5_NAELO|nr:uncharacterized protein C9374_004258 [Naegleria lovaniensis]KAG2383587.1 hypothetical protein C9374_004258 [Naegleria lovaniensis]
MDSSFLDHDSNNNSNNNNTPFHPSRILIPGSITIKSLAPGKASAFLEKNTLLPSDIHGFYEMSLLLLLPFTHPGALMNCQEICDEYNKLNMKKEMKDKITQAMKYQKCFMVLNHPSYFRNEMSQRMKMKLFTDGSTRQAYFIILQNHHQKQDEEEQCIPFTQRLDQLQQWIKDKMEELFSRSELSCHTQQPHKSSSSPLWKECLQLFKDSSQYIDVQHCGSEMSIQQVFEISSTPNITITSPPFSIISQSTLDRILDQCIFTYHQDQYNPIGPSSPFLNLVKSSKYSIDFIGMNDLEFKHAKYLVLREVNNVYSVFDHPQHAFVCIQHLKRHVNIEKHNHVNRNHSLEQLREFLSLDVYHCPFQDIDAHNRELYTLNVFKNSSKKKHTLVNIREAHEYKIHKKALKLENSGTSSVEQTMTNTNFPATSNTCRFLDNNNTPTPNTTLTPNTPTTLTPNRTSSIINTSLTPNTKNNNSSSTVISKTSGGFILSHFSLKSIIRAFKRDIPGGKRVKIFASLGKQVFYSSKFEKISQHSSMLMNDFRLKKIGRMNDVKTLFFSYIEHFNEPSRELLNKYRQRMSCSETSNHCGSSSSSENNQSNVENQQPPSSLFSHIPQFNAIIFHGHSQQDDVSNNSNSSTSALNQLDHGHNNSTIDHHATNSISTMNDHQMA